MLEVIEKLEKLSLKLEDYDEIYDTVLELEDCYNEMKQGSISDIDKFKRELEVAGLMTEELREFVDRYMQFDNYE